MGEYLKKVSVQITEFLKGLSPVRKAAMAVTAFGVLFTMAMLFYWAGDKTYVPLMANLSPEDSINIRRVLDEKHIPYHSDPAGKQILVPPEERDRLMVQLAETGLPQSSAGYELFDKQSLGQTSFVQKINQKRALEGELMRTINTIKGVKRSRVHLAIPQKSAFVEDQKKSTASVVLDLEPGTVLADKQVYGIGNLVARAVEGMDVADVTIMESSGKVRSKNNSDPLAAATATQLDYQQKVEGDAEKRIEEMLTRVVGEGRVVAKVTAELDFAQVSETQTTYDADGAAVRSVEIRNDSMNGQRPGPYGGAGAQANQPNQPAPAGGEVKYDTVHKNEITNNEIPQTVRRTTKPSGTIKRLSVAVVVDDQQYKEVAKDGTTQNKSKAWDAARMAEFEKIVASAVGLDRKRGDVLEIKPMAFAREDLDDAARLLAENEHREYVKNMTIYAVIGLTIALFFLGVVRPFIKWMTENTIDSVDTFLPQTIEELERLQKNQTLPGLEETVPVLPEKMDPEKVEGEMIKEKIVTLVDANPHKAALILKDWLHAAEAAKKKAEAAKAEEKGKTA